MSQWLKANWKYLLAAVAGFVIVVLLYLRTRASSTASQVSFPANPISGFMSGAGAASTPSTPAGPAAATPPAGTFNPGASGITTWRGNTYRWIVTGPGQGLQDAAAFFSSQPGTLGRISDTIGRLGFFDTASTSDASGATFWILPMDLRGYQPGDLPHWQDLVYGGHTPFGAGLGQGGPGLVSQADVAGRLSTAALAAEAGSHRAALSDPRLSRRLGHDARQAVRESRRLFVESRGAAPTRRAGGTRWAR